MLRIVILPGVGFHTDEDEHTSRLMKTLRREFNGLVSYCNWNHKFKQPDISFSKGFIKAALRKWLAEIIFDFQQVTTNCSNLELPEANVYIRHSAGSLLALKQDKPAIIFGSPAAIVGKMNFDASIQLTSGHPILNIINKKDPIAYPLPYNYIDNRYVKFGLTSVKCHTGYWDNRKVVNEIVTWIKYQQVTGKI